MGEWKTDVNEKNNRCDDDSGGLRRLAVVCKCSRAERADNKRRFVILASVVERIVLGRCFLKGIFFEKIFVQ